MAVIRKETGQVEHFLTKPSRQKVRRPCPNWMDLARLGRPEFGQFGLHSALRSQRPCRSRHVRFTFANETRTYRQAGA
jgi:hypothetical protein